MSERELTLSEKLRLLASILDRSGDAGILRWRSIACHEAASELERAAALPQWMHVKRGSIVTEIGRGFAQVSHHPIEEMTAVVIYRHDGERHFWVRNAVEFDDGRFVAVTQDKQGT